MRSGVNENAGSIISACPSHSSAQLVWQGTICAAPVAALSKLTRPQPSPMLVMMPTSPTL